MRIASLVLSVLFAVTMVSVGIPLMLKKIPPNAAIGIRISQTFQDTDLWYSVNAHAGQLMVWIGALVGLAALVLFFTKRISDLSYFLVAIIGVTIGSLVIILLPILHMNSLDGR